MKTLLCLLSLFSLMACQTPVLPSATPNAQPFRLLQVHHASEQQPTLAPFRIHGINYYPQDTPWEDFWPQFNADIISQDFQLIHKLGFNTVRIFVPYREVGGAQLQPQFRRDFKHLIQIARQHQLKLIVTLFDLSVDYQDIPGSLAYLQQLVQGHENEPSILAWDLKNESDLDRAYIADAQLDHWLHSMISALKQRVQQKLTASVASAYQLKREVYQDLDYLTFHFYRPVEELPEHIRYIKSRFNKAIVLGEYGYHTWENAPQDKHILEHQYNYFNAVQAQILNADLAGGLAWNLYDYADTARAQILQDKAVNRHLGLIDRQGQPKPGVLALNQAAYVVDADNGNTATLNSRRLEILFDLASSAQVNLKLKQHSKVLKEWQSQKSAGVQKLKIALSAQEIKDLLELRTQLEISSQGGLLRTQTEPSFETTLRIRLK